MTTGACLCGAVRFSGDPVSGRGIGVCHCGMCRISGGGPMMAVRFTGGVVLQSGDALVWYRSSPDGERGFCSRCGSSLSWRATGLPPERTTDWAVNVNALGDGHGLAIREHIHTADKPDFYDFTDTAPRL